MMHYLYYVLMSSQGESHDKFLLCRSKTGLLFNLSVASQIIQSLAMIFRCVLKVQCGKQLLFLDSIAEASRSWIKSDVEIYRAGHVWFFCILLNCT